MAMKLIVLSGLSAVALAVHAADVYRWVDENGRPHFSDTVPEKYKSTATRIDLQHSKPTAAQRQEAEARAAKDKAIASQASNKDQSANEGAAPGMITKPVAPSSQSSAKSEGTDCATLFRLYWKSQECFAPYRLPNGAIKAEAFERCTAVPDPSHKCGPPYEIR